MSGYLFKKDFITARRHDLNKNTIYMCRRDLLGSVGLQSRSNDCGFQFVGAFLSKLLSFGLSLRLQNFAVH